VHVNQCVSAFRAVEVPVLVCLRSSCNGVTEVGGRRAVRFVRLALKVVMQNDGDFVNIILLYLRLGASYRSLDCFSLDDGTDRLSRNVSNSTTNLRCVTSRKSEYLV
jgi:hypothetical protein